MYRSLCGRFKYLTLNSPAQFFYKLISIIFDVFVLHRPTSTKNTKTGTPTNSSHHFLWRHKSREKYINYNVFTCWLFFFWLILRVFFCKNHVNPSALSGIFGKTSVSTWMLFFGLLFKLKCGNLKVFVYKRILVKKKEF